MGTFLFGPIVLPFYLARRPLKIGETREGGTGWNVLRNFAILWTIVMAIVSISALMSMASVTSGVKSGAEMAGAGIGMVLGVGFMAFAWFVPTFGAALIGFLLKKNSVVERGPTGALVGDTSGTSVFSGWLGLVGASFLALVLILVLTAHYVRSSIEATSGGEQQSASSGAKPEWRLTEGVSEMDGIKTIELSRDAENETQGSIGTVHPSIHIRCRGKKTELYIDVGTQVESNFQYGTSAVRLKFDNGAAVQQWWSQSKDGSALFAPEPVKLAKRLSSAQALRFEFTPFQHGAQVATFELAGLQQHLSSAATGCGWTLP
jgi:hypothetical protein